MTGEECWTHFVTTMYLGSLYYVFFVQKTKNLLFYAISLSKI